MPYPRLSRPFLLDPEQFNDQAEILIRFNVPQPLLRDAAVHAIVAIIRELTDNAIRHGHAWTVRVAGTVDRGTLHFSVSDDGCGFDPDDRLDSNDGHFGLDGIKERIERLNGTLAITASRQSSAKAIVHIPLTKMKNIRILIADDHKLMRMGLSSLIAGETDRLHKSNMPTGSGIRRGR